ncbi:hypothetical protein HDA42_002356 [Streptomyces costaricanus]|uniref:Uncharacterized protein n=1 Tax=Streptomyces murinus TaxID=33900 RepID=A0A7W3NMC9_STRMR|nr:hypothetical protein [Streptomyces murinus]
MDPERGRQASGCFAVPPIRAIRTPTTSSSPRSTRSFQILEPQP